MAPVKAGDIYGHLTVIEETNERRNHSKVWVCRCDCGNLKKISTKNIKKGKTCGYCGLKLDCNNKPHNKYDLSGEYGIGYTSKGDKFYFDLEDYDKIYPFCWYKMNNDYICYKGNNGNILMHRLITNAPINMEVDHINHNKIDNRKSNLRICTTTENMINRRGMTKLKTGIQYIKFNKQCNKFQIKYKGKHYGLYNCIADANDELEKILNNDKNEYTYMDCLYKNDVRTELYIDLDCVVFNTIKTIVDLYNEDFQYYENYENVNWIDIDSREFVECKCATNEDINLYFTQPRFFEKLTLIENSIEVITQLQKEYAITFVTIGHPANLLQKQIWLNKNIPGCKFIGLDMNEFTDKSCINMNNGIFIDDSELNLITSNAKRKYLFGDIYSWNSNWSGDRLHNWYEVLAELVLPD